MQLPALQVSASEGRRLPVSLSISIASPLFLLGRARMTTSGGNLQDLSASTGWDASSGGKIDPPFSTWLLYLPLHFFFKFFFIFLSAFLIRSDNNNKLPSIAIIFPNSLKDIPFFWALV